LAKAITEVAIGAAAIGAAFLIPGAGIAIGGLLISHAAAVGALVSIGASEIMAGVSSALAKNQGGLAVGVTTPIGPWGYIYGTQKVGGVEIFRESNSSQGTSNDKELHRVYMLACHPCALGSWQLRIDGKQVLLTASGSGWVSYSPTQITQNIVSISRASGVVTMVLAAPMPSGTDGTTLQMRSIADGTFNGTFTVTQPNPADFTTWTYVCGGPDTTTSGGNARTCYSNYKDKIYVEFLNGNHTSTFAGLLASGTTWGVHDLCLGRTLVYVRMGYDDGVFPSSIPNVSFVIDGKNDILDPRTGLRGFTNNAALCIADFLSLPATQGGFGLTIGTDIPTAQLIAAANICDEAVALAGGGTIKRYTCDTFLQLNVARGAILKDLLSSCAGRISYQGGQYSIFPAAWAAPTLQLTDADIVGPMHWKPRLPIRSTCNAVKGTYVSPENAYQQADVPAYMQDAAHGYVSDPWLAEDNGERIFLEANFPCTNSSATAQRLEKIALLRTRYQGRGTIRCSLKAYTAVALDVIQITHPRYTWAAKNFEVLSSRFVVDKSGEAPVPYVELDIAETDSTIYDWSITEQLTPQGYKQPNNVGVSVCNPPEHVNAYSGLGATISGIVYPPTVVIGADGRVQNSIYVRWDSPNDANVVHGGHLEVQYQKVGDSVWAAAGGKIDPSASYIFIPNVTDGVSYNVQVRAVNCAGVPSDWIATGAVTVSKALSSLAAFGVPVAPAGTLVAEAYGGGAATVFVQPFTATLGNASAACLPGGAFSITGLAQSSLYEIYYIDPTFAGGAVTPVATQNPADYLNKAGYYLIGVLVTPPYSSSTGGPGAQYRPSLFADIGSRSTLTPGAAYDQNPSSSAVVSANYDATSGIISFGSCLFNGFPALVTPSGLNLHISLSAAAAGIGWGVQEVRWQSGSGGWTATSGSGFTPFAEGTGSAARATYSLTLGLPAGVWLQSLGVLISVGNSGTVGTPASQIAALSIFDIWVS
jgi:Putative phage tail protein